MRNQILYLSLCAALMATGCNQVECADGTIERDGKCEASNLPPGLPGRCGPFTELVGDQCVPTFPPTECDPGSTEPSVDPETGVTTCKGMGTGVLPCGVPLTCSAGSSSTKQTICGQIYDLKDGSEFRAANAMGLPCPTTPTADGPCALTIRAYDAVDFADGGNPPAQLTAAETYLDECGRYRLKDVDVSTVVAYVGLGVDDASGLGPGGVSVTTAVATAKAPAKLTNLDAYMVTAATAGGWMAGGVNFGSTGVYALIFRAKKSATDRSLQAGVTVQKSGVDQPNNDFYFGPTATDRTTIDTNATATGANGTALINSANVNDFLVWGARGGLSAGCKWEQHAGATLPGIVFVQEFRKTDATGMTCPD